MRRFKRIYIEITNICNLNCSFCPIEERSQSVMAIDKFEHIIQQVAPLTEQVCLHLMGEPLAHPNFKEVLNLCEKYNTKIQLTTNGLLLNKYKELLLNSKSIAQINISVQSYLDNFPTKPIQEYLDKIYSFITESLSKRPDLYLNIRLWNITTDQNDENEPIFRYLEDKLGITINRKVELGNIKSKKLVEKLYLHFDSRFEWPRIEDDVLSTQGRCNGLKNHFAIHANGNISPCCLDDQNTINLGNVFEDSIDSVLESKRVKAMINGFKNNQLVEDLCRRCGYIERFRK